MRDWKTGQWIKLKFEDVKAAFETAGCQLFSTEYKNARTPLDYVCSCGNRASIIFDSFRRGHRCAKCGRVKAAQSQKSTLEEARNMFKDAGLTLLEDTYIDSSSPMRFICGCGRQSVTNLNRIQQYKAKGCLQCSIDRRSGENHYEWKKDRLLHAEENLFRQRTYKLVRHSLMFMNRKKTARTHDLLGYTHEDLRNHITSHPNWERVKDENWQTDHIFPVRAFLDYGIKDLSIINALDNLRPISAAENRAKSDSYDAVAFEEWLRERGVSQNGKM